MKTTKPVEDLVAVEVDTRNAKLDRMVPRVVVKHLREKGLLHWDVTNGMPCCPENGECIPEIRMYKMRG